MTEDLNTDPRWRRFIGEGPPAATGRVFNGVFDIAFDHPDPWPHGNRAEQGLEVFERGEDRLTSDLCKLGPHRFIRAVLILPIQGTDETFSFGAWGGVNPQNFDAYVAANLPESTTAFEGCFAWMMNRLPGVLMDDWIPCDLLPHDDPTQRPLLSVHDGHDLAGWQEEGITFDQLLDIYAAAGQDIRPHLMDA